MTLRGLAMTDDGCRVNSLVDSPEASPITGHVRWDPLHSLWHGGMLAGSAPAIGTSSHVWLNSIANSG